MQLRPVDVVDIKKFVRRDDVSLLIPPGGICAELGVSEGVFSERLLQRSALGHLFSIDMYAGDRGHGVKQYLRALKRLMPYSSRNTVIRARFDEALELFPDGHFDFIYVDGYAHTGEEDGATFREWFPKVKPGGVFAGDDYSLSKWPKVVKQVDQFMAANKLKLHVIDCSEPGTGTSLYPTWLAIKPK